MAVTFIRTLIVVVTLIILMRLMGKRQIGEMQPFEFIITLIIADLACIPMTDVSIPLVYGIVAIACLFILHQLLSLLEQGGTFFKRIISGKPSVVINKNGIDLIELKKNNLGIDDLIESMRALGYFSLDDLSYAIYESNGNLSALENPSKEQNHNSIPILMVSDGKIDKNNLTFINEKEENLKNFIKSKNSTLKQVEVMTIDGNGRVYFKQKSKPYQIFNYTFEGETKW